MDRNRQTRVGARTRARLTDRSRLTAAAAVDGDGAAEVFGERPILSKVGQQTKVDR